MRILVVWVILQEHCLQLIIFYKKILARKIRTHRYASFDIGKGKEFEEGKLSFADLRAFAIEKGEPAVMSGKQGLLKKL